MKKYLLLLSAFLSVFYLVSAQTAGSIDYSFDPGQGFNLTIDQIVIQPDGKILCTGPFSEYNGIPANGIIRLNTDGSIDQSFNAGSGFDCCVGKMALLSDGKILISGGFSSYNGVSVPSLVKLNSDGSIDNSFTLTSLAEEISLIGLQSTGKMIVRGYFDGLTSFPSGYYLGRLNPDGSADESFNFQDHDDVWGKIDNDTIYAIDSNYDPVIDDFRKTIVELDPDGVFQQFASPSPFFYPHPIFGVPGYRGYIQDVAFLPNEKMIVAGDFSELFDTSGTTTPRIGVLDEFTGIDSSFDAGTGFNDAVYALGLDNMGQMLVGGAFNFYQGSPQNRLIRLNLDGSIDSAFDIGTGFSGTLDNWVPSFVSVIAVQPDGKIIVGGNFTSYDGVSRSCVVRLNGNLTSVSSETSENLEISVYPNPSNGLFRIETNGIIEYRVYNALGKLVRRTTTRAKLIDLTDEPSGIYVLRLRTENGWATQKLVKQ